ncbi:MAG: hypothetical protein M3Y58_24010, partial [Chloroflexota bacterium]|nr:hypothetical protein [Chloroflexota bacterium]
IIFVLFPGIILGFILLSRYLKYRETLTMIQHGITPPQPPVMMAPPMMPRPPVAVQQRNGSGGRATLIWGLVLTGIGIALTLALWPIGFIANSASGNSINFPLGLGPWMLAGFVPLFVGLALILGYVITRPERGSDLNPPPAQWASGFPMGVGGVTGAYSHTPYGNGSPPVPVETVVHEEASEPAPPTGT